MGNSDKGAPDKIKRESASFLGTGLGEAHKTTIHKGGSTYTGKGFNREQADRNAGENYRKGRKDK